MAAGIMAVGICRFGFFLDIKMKYDRLKRKKEKNNMDNVLFGLGFLSLAGVIAFLVIAVVRIFKKKPRKNFVVAALICFVASNVFIFVEHKPTTIT